MKGDSILIFGGAILQHSIIERCNLLGLRTVVVDPDPNASGKDLCDVFIELGGNDFEGTCNIVETYDIKGIVTAATDKPLVMMARIAEKYNFPFYSVDTAQLCTDKYQMQQRFIANDIPCARGEKLFKHTDAKEFPLIIKPVDNSGSRGVFYCASNEELEALFHESLTHTKKDYVLSNTVLKGQEYSIESTHMNGKHTVVQITTKITTPFPYNVELSHISPSPLPEKTEKQIEALIVKIAEAFNFENCVAHTELMIDGDSITVIETSPRTGGDYITSHLVPLSTAINIEDLLISNALGETPKNTTPAKQHAGIFYFTLPSGNVSIVNDLSTLLEREWIHKIHFRLKEGDPIPQIKNSLDRYGFVVLSGTSLENLEERKIQVFDYISEQIRITSLQCL